MNRVLLVVVVLIVGGGLIAGFAVVGGPQYARMERHDRERANDLRALADYHRCRIAAEGGNAGTAATPGCLGYEQAPDLVDPVTGAPYRYEDGGGDGFRICATFETETLQRETAGPPSSFLTFDGREGCVEHGVRLGDDAATGTTPDRSRD